MLRPCGLLYAFDLDLRLPAQEEGGSFVPNECFIELSTTETHHHPSDSHCNWSKELGHASQAPRLSILTLRDAHPFAVALHQHLAVRAQRTGTE